LEFKKGQIVGVRLAGKSKFKSHSIQGNVGINPRRTYCIQKE